MEKKSQNIGAKSTFMPKLYTPIHYNNSIQLMRNKKLKKKIWRNIIKLVFLFLINSKIKYTS